MRHLLLFACLWSLTAAAQPYQPTAANLAARKAFQDDKFGLFIHWGVYSVLGDGEWVMNNRQIPIREYEKLPMLFNPTQFDAKAWVSIAKQAGMRYITITSKHHDGFAMWHSKVSPYNIVNATPYKKDVLKLLADECKAQGIKLFFYHSHLDWHHPDYFPRGKTGGYWTGRPEAGNFDTYLRYMDAQLAELLGGDYGAVAGIWFDGWWDQARAEMDKSTRDTRVDWQLRRTYDLIHKLQPAALIGNNHHVAPFEGEDFQMFERDLPGQNTFGHNTNEISTLPLESCETLNGAWGFNLKDSRYKSARDLVHYLVKSAGRNANFLLNVGPMPNGQIQPEFVSTLAEVGKWTSQFGETIYGTRGGPIAPRPWGVTTAKGKRVFVHLLDWNDRQLSLPALPGRVKSATLFTTKATVQVTQSTDGVLLTMPNVPDSAALDTVIELEMD
jgi:alpha-L-fucosidase